MKLQLEGQHLRVRISEEELAVLLSGQTVTARTQFADAFALSCCMSLIESDKARIGGQADGWFIGLPDAGVRAHAMTLPSREGLAFTLENRVGTPLELLFDVDVRDSVRHRHGKPAHEH